MGALIQETFGGDPLVLVAEWPDGAAVLRRKPFNRPNAVHFEYRPPRVPFSLQQGFGFGIQYEGDKIETLNLAGPRLRIFGAAVHRLRWLLSFLGVRGEDSAHRPVLLDLELPEFDPDVLLLERRLPVPGTDPILDRALSELDGGILRRLGPGSEADLAVQGALSELTSLVTPSSDPPGIQWSVGFSLSDTLAGPSSFGIRANVNWQRTGVQDFRPTGSARGVWGRLLRAAWVPEISTPDSEEAPGLLELRSSHGTMGIFVAREDLPAWISENFEPGTSPVSEEVLEIYRLLGDPLPFLWPFDWLLEWAREL